MGNANGSLLVVAAMPSVMPKPLPFVWRALHSSRLVSQRESVSFCGPAFGVGHGADAVSATAPSVTVALLPSGRRPLGVVPSGAVCPPLGVVGVGPVADSDSSLFDGPSAP